MSVMSIKFIMFNRNLLFEICEQFLHPLTIHALSKADVTTSHQNINQMAMTGILINSRSSQRQWGDFHSKKMLHS